MRTKRINVGLYHFRERDVRWFYGKWHLPKIGRLFVVRNILGLLSRIEPTCTQSEDSGQYVIGVGLMPTTEKMVGENKGRKGKKHGLSCDINRNNTHEYENKNNTVTKEI